MLQNLVAIRFRTSATMAQRPKNRATHTLPSLKHSKTQQLKRLAVAYRKICTRACGSVALCLLTARLLWMQRAESMSVSGKMAAVSPLLVQALLLQARVLARSTVTVRATLFLATACAIQVLKTTVKPHKRDSAWGEGRIDSVFVALSRSLALCAVKKLRQNVHAIVFGGKHKWMHSVLCACVFPCLTPLVLRFFPFLRKIF